MKKKLIIIIITIIAVLSIGGGIVLMNSNSKPPKKEDPKTQEKTVTEYVEKLNKVIMDGGTKQQYLSVLRRDQILNTDIMTGPDMYLRQKPSNKVIQKNSLSSYTKKGEELAKKLEKAIKDNFECEIEGVLTKEDYLAVLVTYKSFYYNAYVKDLNSIQNELLIKVGYDFDNLTKEQEKTIEVDSYKAKVKAASLLNDRLDMYKNNEESKRVYINFDGKKIEGNSDNFLSYLMNLEGYTYTNQGYFTSVDKTNEFINSLNITDPLAL